MERFSNLETGQSATMDAPLAMTLITEAAVRTTSPIRQILDIGCGAGNNSLKLHQTLGADFDIDLMDLSEPMLQRAVARLGQVNAGRIIPLQVDVRQAILPEGKYDIVLAAAVLHHLRSEEEWRAVFQKVHSSIRPGGSFWITDLVSQELPAVQQLMDERYGAYLTSLGGEAYRDKVQAYIDQEDSPRSVTFQLELLRSVGFATIEILHKNACFAAFGAIKRA